MGDTRTNSAAAGLEGILSLDDLQRLAARRLPKALYEYIASGTDDEQTLQENRAAFKRVLLRPRFQVNTKGVRLDTRVLGADLRLPVLLSPAGVHCLCDDEGERASARAAAAAGSLFCLSQHATRTIEDVAAAAPRAPRWYQTYILKDRSVTERLVRRAVAAGYSAIILTVDSAVFGSREADFRNGFVGLPPHLSLANYGEERGGWDDREKGAWDQNTEQLFDREVSWADVAWLKRVAGGLPVVVKGILCPEDALLAVDAGADGIIVSNHGGRQLDGCMSSIEALPLVADAVRSHPRGGEGFCVMMDGGVRRGTDVVKAIALGAKAVLLGKPTFFALAAGGEAGVRHMFALLEQEMVAAMTLMGVRRIGDLSREHVHVRADSGAVYARARL